MNELENNCINSLKNIRGGVKKSDEELEVIKEILKKLNMYLTNMCLKNSSELDIEEIKFLETPFKDIKKIEDINDFKNLKEKEIKTILRKILYKEIEFDWENIYYWHKGKYSGEYEECKELVENIKKNEYDLRTLYWMNRDIRIQDIFFENNLIIRYEEKLRNIFLFKKLMIDNSEEIEKILEILFKILVKFFKKTASENQNTVYW